MVICTVEELKQRGSFGFELEWAGQPLSGFVVWHEGEVVAYTNSCPHTGATLEWQPHVFLSPEGSHIQCALHGALFSIDDGYCIAGPCTGESLAPLEAEIVSGEIVLKEPDVPSSSQ